MLTFPTNRDLQVAGLKVLKSLLDSWAWRNSWLHELSGSGLKVVIAALKTFPTDIIVQRLGMCVVCMVSRYHYAFKDTPEELSPFLSLIIKAMRAYPDQATIQEAGCSILAVIHLSTKDPLAEIGEEGGCEMVLAAMKAHVVDVGVQMEGCCALDNLLGSDKVYVENRVSIAELGGIQVIVKAVERYVANRNVYLRGTSAISKLVVDAESAKVVVESEVMGIILAGTELHEDDGDLLEPTCRSLSSFVKNYEGDRARLMEMDLLQAVVLVIDTHPDFDRLVAVACCALESILKGCASD